MSRIVDTSEEVARIDAQSAREVALIDAAVQCASVFHECDDTECEGLTPRVRELRDTAASYLRDLFVRHGTKLPEL